MSHDELIIDRLADEFEVAWQSGERPEMMRYLNQVEPASKQALARLLIPIDIEYRLRAGETIESGLWQELGSVFVILAESVLRNRSEGTGSNISDKLAAFAGDGREQKGRTNTDPIKNQQVGPYRLVQRLGAGGMGEVWMAEQYEPVKRRVAIKLIQAGKNARQYIARFEAERQALALMDHPNIAKILDAGVTEDAQPFYVMELVVGAPLTKFCDEHRLTINQRLELFIDICAGVQHAHQKGIVHRDLKPGNIIVGEIDGRPVPKVIDFGLAKAMESAERLTDDPDVTALGQLLGTLKYMSPEQAGLENLDIDTRADINALGVILYELLTGSTPLDDSSIRGQAQHAVLEFIREKERVKPSRKLSSSTDEQVSTITGKRQTDSVRLKRVLLGDLDWIVMKALTAS
ncbi:MAG: serine/threonine protein kinase [Pirellulaceae bacterium]|nr:serine/threonine protein kinase [Pirellulaceae bacterium]